MHVERFAKRFSEPQNRVSLFQPMEERRCLGCDFRRPENQEPNRREKKELPTLLICDSQAVKNTDTADKDTRGFCHYKATNGIKRHCSTNAPHLRLCVDVLGTPFFVTCTPANVSDDEGLVTLVRDNLAFFVSLPVISSEHTLTILCDSGYNKVVIEKKLVALYADILSKIVIEIAVKMSPSEKTERGVTGFVVVAKRWIVERSNAWLDKCRLLWKNGESKLATSIAAIKVCFIRLILRRLY